ncbi:MAG: hypothetical protein JJU06_12695 [Ectothiorhodospiraceae bacterium]|nr:hypothetical protein [Ectothiorhodospiraceae bacterium]
MSRMIISTPDALRQSVEAATGGRMTVLYDDHGLPNYMYVIPRFRYEDLGFDSELGSGVVTAFLVDGQQKDEIFIGAYQASRVGDVACSLPGREVWRSINWDDSLAACTTKGEGWHMMTVHEWAAVALFCKANGYEPTGNTDYGRHHDNHHEFGRRSDGGDLGDSSGVGNIFAGTGPDAWRHDGSPTGIADLVGNVWEWLWGAKLQDGRIYAVEDNDTSVDESSWQDTGADLTDANPWTSSDVTGTQLTDRILFTYPGIDLGGRLYVNDEGERFPRRGGSRGNGSDAGLAALSLNDSRSLTYTHTGFRPAFVI